MKSKVTNLTLDEHKQLAEDLRKIVHRLHSLISKDCRGMGLTCYLRRLAFRNLRALDDLRSELDNDLCRKFPTESYPSIYYGHSDLITHYEAEITSLASLTESTS